MRDHEIAQLVNTLRDVALQFHSSPQLRERIAHLIRPWAGDREPAIPESAILHRMKYHPRPADGEFPADWDLYEPGGEPCADCVDVLIVRADTVRAGGT